MEVNKENQASIVITDHTFKKELFRLKGKEHELFVHPSFDGKKYILTVVVSPSGKRLERIDLKNGKERIRHTGNELRVRQPDRPERRDPLPGSI